MKNAIALLITIFFVMAITLSIGIGLKYINNTKKSISEEQFLLQSTSIFKDILSILKNNKQLNEITNATSLDTFLSQYSWIPFTYKDTSVVVKIQSARGRLNPNIFKDTIRLEMLKQYLINKMILPQYADMLLDSISGIKKDGSYHTNIFDNNPTLFRDYIVSDKQLERLNTIYKNTYHDNNIKNINIKNLFYPTKEDDTSVDLNYATPEVFELILGCTTSRAKELSYGQYKNLEDLNLNPNEKQNLKKFKYSFYEPYIDINIQIDTDDKSISLSSTIPLTR